MDGYCMSERERSVKLRPFCDLVYLLCESGKTLKAKLLGLSRQHHCSARIVVRNHCKARINLFACPEVRDNSYMLQL